MRVTQPRVTLSLKTPIMKTDKFGIINNIFSGLKSSQIVHLLVTMRYSITFASRL